MNDLNQDELEQELRYLRLQRAKLSFKLGEQKAVEADVLQIVMSLKENFEGNEIYWVYIHLFTTQSNPALSKKALFKAYSLNPANPTVIAALLTHYYTNKELSKFFHALHVASKINQENPHVLRVLTAIHATVAFSDAEGVQTMEKLNILKAGLILNSTYASVDDLDMVADILIPMLFTDGDKDQGRTIGRLQSLCKSEEHKEGKRFLA
mmetsp:Transcript_6339/g.10304  ORF Transcript_6339/g.10304 Transcript_6339/m.10304 type:complete len:209 (-) Transcript_6339:1437-2063(-)